MSSKHITRSISRFNHIYQVVRRIPRGRVATYGQVALLADLPGRARLVGYALAALSGKSNVPWHRVVNALGRISPRGAEPFMAEQYGLLKREGVKFSSGGVISLTRFGWAYELKGKR